MKPFILFYSYVGLAVGIGVFHGLPRADDSRNMRAVTATLIGVAWPLAISTLVANEVQRSSRRPHGAGME